jgi:hypothetical protein
MIQPRGLETFYKMAVALGCLSMICGLFAFAYLGDNMRYSGDDYCYGWSLTRFGFWDAQVESYLHPMPYHGNRFALTLFSTLSSLPPPRFNGLLPAAALLLWVAALFYTVRVVAAAAGAQLWVGEALFLATALPWIASHTAPSVEQSLYWRSGMLPYLAPTIGVTLLLGMVLSAPRTEQPSAGRGLVVGFLALLVGGFSETGLVVQAGLLALGGAWLAFEWRRGSRVAGVVGAWVSAAAGCALAAFLLLVSPSIRGEAIAHSFPEDLVRAVGVAAGNVKVFLLNGLLRYPAAHLLSASGATLMAVQHHGAIANPAPVKPGTRLAALSALGFALLLLIFCAMLPFAYVQDSYPEDRALILPRYLTLGAIALGGWVLGGWLTHPLPRWGRAGSALRGVVLLVLLGLWILPARAAGARLAELPRYQRWSHYWDRRHEHVLEAKAQGLEEVEVMEIDHIIPNVGDLSPDPGYWYNRCAAGWYGLRALRATLPGWDD